MLRAPVGPRIIFSLHVAQGYVINSTYTRLSANIPLCHIQAHSIYLLLIKLDQNFLLDNNTWRISLAFGFTCLLT